MTVSSKLHFHTQGVETVFIKPSSAAIFLDFLNV